MRWIWALATVSLVYAVVSAKDDKRSLRTVSEVDLRKYAGKWYEIAKLPNRFEKECVSSVTANYALRDDGKITVLNQCKKSSGEIKASKGTAKVADQRTKAKLKVTFFWPFYGDYQIIELGPNYEYAVVGEPGRKYLWILSRAPQLDDGLYRQLLERAAQQGFDTSRVVRTPQP